MCHAYCNIRGRDTISKVGVCSLFVVISLEIMQQKLYTLIFLDFSSKNCLHIIALFRYTAITTKHLTMFKYSKIGILTYGKNLYSCIVRELA